MMSFKQKNGTNNDINSLMQNLNEDQLIPILPEMQQMFDINQLEAQQQQAFNRGTLPIDNFNGQPQIMDQSIINMARTGKLPLPMINSFQMSPPIGQGMEAPMAGNIFEAGFQGTGKTGDNVPNLMESDMELKNIENKLMGGGNKNFFLKKKK